MNKPAGYFYWDKGLKNTPSPVKLDAAIGDAMMENTRKALTESIVPGSKRGLDEHHWSLTLDELAKLYPYRLPRCD